MHDNSNRLVMVFLVLVMVFILIVNLMTSGVSLKHLDCNATTSEKKTLKTMHGLSILLNISYFFFTGYFVYNHCFRNSYTKLPYDLTSSSLSSSEQQNLLENKVYGIPNGDEDNNTTTARMRFLPPSRPIESHERNRDMSSSTFNKDPNNEYAY